MRLIKKYHILIAAIILSGLLLVVLLSEVAEQDKEAVLRSPTAIPTRLVSPTQDCQPTAIDSEGPFYLTGSPHRNNLAPEDAEGKTLILKGRVLNQDCRPVAGATLDLWHADSNGEYQDNWYRGKVRTDSSGAYRFETVMPSAYGAGSTRRPPHIHYKVWLGEREVLTSQIYFAAELLSQVGETRLAELTQAEEKLAGSFDIVVNTSR